MGGVDSGDAKWAKAMLDSLGRLWARIKKLARGLVWVVEIGIGQCRQLRELGPACDRWGEIRKAARLARHMGMSPSELCEAYALAAETEQTLAEAIHAVANERKLREARGAAHGQGGQQG